MRKLKQYRVGLLVPIVKTIEVCSYSEADKEARKLADEMGGTVTEVHEVGKTGYQPDIDRKVTKLPMAAPLGAAYLDKYS